MKDILHGIELFNDGNFFEAHDFFEDIWIDCKTDDKKFFQSLVHISVGCFHLISGNYSGSKSQFEKFIDKVNRFSPIYYEIDIESLISQISFLIDQIKEKKENKPSDFWKLIPKIEFINKNSQTKGGPYGNNDN